MELRWRGYCRYDGYGTATYYYVKELRKQGIKVQFEPVRTSKKLSREFRSLSDKTKVSQDSLIVDHNTEESEYPDVRYLVWEGLKAPKIVVDLANDCREVWTASEFCKDSFYYGGVDRPIYVIPHGIDPDLFHPRKSSSSTDEYIFLTVGAWLRRKNFYKLAGSFYYEFKNEPVKLMIHTSPEGRKTILEEWSRKVRKKLILTTSFPLTFKEIPSLFSSADAFISTSFGEGFGLPLLEAGACGLSICTTYWSAPPEFLQEYAYYIPIHHLARMPLALEEEGTFLAETDYEQIRMAMRYIYDNQDEARKRGKLLSRHLRKNYTWANAVKLIKKRIKHLSD